LQTQKQDRTFLPTTRRFKTPDYERFIEEPNFCFFGRTASIVADFQVVKNYDRLLLAFCPGVHHSFFCKRSLSQSCADVSGQYLSAVKTALPALDNI